MQFRKIQHRHGEKASSMGSTQIRKPGWRRMAACLGVVGVLTVTAQPAQQGTTPPDRGSIYSPYLTTPPDANAQMKMHEENAKKQNFEAANALRKKQIADESALLLKLATDLKSEVDKTNKDTLSISVVRKAEAIEKLARDVKDKMKVAVSAN
jgi:hypothetical protein